MRQVAAPLLLSSRGLARAGSNQDAGKGKGRGGGEGSEFEASAVGADVATAAAAPVKHSAPLRRLALPAGYGK